LEREVYPKSAQINGALERKLERDRERGRLHPEVRARQLANVAWATAHGLVSLASSMEAVQGNLRFTIQDLCDEACRNLVRGAERRGAGGGSGGAPSQALAPGCRPSVDREPKLVVSDAAVVVLILVFEQPARELAGVEQRIGV